MKISLIICTYMRPQPIKTLLDSVLVQTHVPYEILIVDGSTDNLTEEALKQTHYKLPLKYFLVPDEYRGLTRQRNYGIARVSEECDVVAFLDDDVVLKENYFEKIVEPYADLNIMGVGGYILDHIDPNSWRKKRVDETTGYKEFEYDGWVRKEDSRNVLRKMLGLAPDTPPCIMSEFSNGRSVGSLPPTGKIYPAEFFMGGVASYRRELFGKIRFSPYFEGYGLYEDLDFTLRASFIGKMVVHTGAQLYHYHDAGGRPNKCIYGKMVVRNGWYVWRLKYPKPRLKAKLKWYSTVTLLMLIRYTNALTGSKKKEAFTEAYGRTKGLLSLVFNPPQRID